MKSAAILTALLAVGVAAVFFVLRRTPEARTFGSPAPTPMEAAPSQEVPAPRLTRPTEVSPAESPPRSAAPVQAPRKPLGASVPAESVAPDWTGSRQLLWGQALGPDGPLSGARATLVDADGQPIVATLTAAQGEFHLPLLRAVENARLIVTAPGHAPFENGPYRVRVDQKRAVGFARLSRSTRATGRVVDASGRPIDKAQVELVSAPSRNQNRFRHRTTTDRDGAFSFDDAPRGEVRLEVSADNFAKNWTSSVTLPAAEPLLIELRQVEPLAVRVEGPDGALADAQVRLVVGGRDGAAFSGSTDASGVARLAGVPDARWSGTVNAAGFHSASFDGNGSSDSPHTVRLEPLACLSGRVTSETGELPSHTTVDVLPVGTDGLPSERGAQRGLAVDAEGVFQACGLGYGRWLARASASEHAPATSSIVSIERGRPHPPVAMQLRRGGALEVRVAGTGGALADAHVVLTGRTSRLEGRTDERGRARFEHLAPGEYEVQLTHPAHLGQAAGPFIVRERGEPTLAVVALEPGRSIHGTVFAPDGSPLAGAEVRVLDGDGTQRTITRCMTAPNGTYRTVPLASGRYRIEARAAQVALPGAAQTVPRAATETVVGDDSDAQTDLYLSQPE